MMASNRIQIPRLTAQSQCLSKNTPRTFRACTNCKFHRVKCSGARPKCKNCASKNSECVYVMERRDKLLILSERCRKMSVLLKRLEALASDGDRVEIDKILKENEDMTFPIPFKPGSDGDDANKGMLDVGMMDVSHPYMEHALGVPNTAAHPGVLPPVPYDVPQSFADPFDRPMHPATHNPVELAQNDNDYGLYHDNKYGAYHDSFPMDGLTYEYGGWKICVPYHLARHAETLVHCQMEAISHGSIYPVTKATMVHCLGWLGNPKIVCAQVIIPNTSNAYIEALKRNPIALVKDETNRIVGGAVLLSIRIATSLVLSRPINLFHQELVYRPILNELDKVLQSPPIHEVNPAFHALPSSQSFIQTYTE